MNHLYGITADTYFAESLGVIHNAGAEWDSHKALAQRQELQQALREVLGYQYAEEVSTCSFALGLYHKTDDDTLAIHPSKTCKRRWCPVCEWRKSLKRWALLVEKLPGLIEKNAPCRFLLLTLTIRNCHIDDLLKTYNRMMDGWRSLTHTRTPLGKLWPATAWIRALEITFPKPKQAHPHFHVLLAVKPSYFKRDYVNQIEWTKRWRQALRIDYDPIVDIRPVKPLNGKRKSTPLDDALGGLREVSKYVVKPSQYHSHDALKGLVSLSGRHFIKTGGWLRGVLNGVKDDDTELPDPERIATYWWCDDEKTYRRLVE